jgi:hypothetical protein
VADAVKTLRRVAKRVKVPSVARSLEAELIWLRELRSGAAYVAALLRSVDQL